VERSGMIWTTLWTGNETNCR